MITGLAVHKQYRLLDEVNNTDCPMTAVVHGQDETTDRGWSSKEYLCKKLEVSFPFGVSATLR